MSDYTVFPVENLSCTPTANGVTVTWTYGPAAYGNPPSHAGAYSLARSTLFGQSGGPACTPDLVNAYFLGYQTADDATSQAFSDMATGVAYTFAISEIDLMSDMSGYEQFWGYPSSDPVIFTAVPGYTTAPQSVSVSPATLSSVTVTWSGPAAVNYGYSVATYQIDYKKSTDSGWTSWGQSASSGITIGPLDIGTSYDVRITPVMNNGALSLSSTIGTGSTVSVSAPTVPLNLTLSRGNASVLVTYDAPTSDGGSAIVDYTVEYSLNNATWTAFPDGTNSVLLSRTVTGLTNGSSYYFRVKATNAAGLTSDPSVVAGPVVPATAPGAPTLSAVAGNQQAVLTWTPGVTNGEAITSNEYMYSTTSATGPWVGSPTLLGPSPFTVTGLTGLTDYWFRARSTNAAGTSAWSASAYAGTTSQFPGQVTGLTATVSSFDTTNAVITLDWIEPVPNGGIDLASYLIERSEDGGLTWIQSYSQSLWHPDYSVSVALDVTHTFRVAAINANGAGPWSSNVSIRQNSPTGSAPSVPLAVEALAGDKKFTVTWQTPAVLGDPGDTVGSYKIRYSTDGVTWTEVTQSA